MTTLTIQAADTASAMDEIAERLGKDALILVYNKKERQGHYASHKRSRFAVAITDRLQVIFHICITQEYPALFLVSLAYQQKCPKKSGIRQLCSQRTNTCGRISPASHDAGFGSDSRQIDQLDSKLSGMMLTGPDGLNAGLQDSTPVQLSRAGYSQNTILRLHTAFADLSYDDGVISFLDCLAEDLVI